MYLSDKMMAARYSVTREAIWKMSRTVPGFPKPVKVSAGTTRWILAEVEAYEAKIVEARENA